MWWNNLLYFLIILIEITNAQRNIYEDDNVSVDAENPKITGVIANDPFSHAVSTNVLKWPLGIVPYYIDTKIYDSIITRRIESAMKTIAGASCVVFKTMVNVPSKTNGSWLHFTNPSQERECIHEPQISEDGEVKVVLGFECMQRRDVLHAVLHALGFMDEVSHPQRDQYIRILWQNLHPKYRSLFRIKLDDRTKTLVEYDPMSVMHFHDRAFSTNGGATIAPLVPGLIINPSENLSQLDKMKLRLHFGHECNKRKVGDILDTCKNVLHENPSDPKKETLQHYVETEYGYSDETEGNFTGKDDRIDSAYVDNEHVVEQDDDSLRER